MAFRSAFEPLVNQRATPLYLLIIDVDHFKQVNAIRQTIEQAIFISQDKRIPVTVSIGLSEYQPGMTLSELLKEADDYFYVAKKNGRNRLVHQTNNESPLTLVK
ncbi:diguanylate cyclase domain-containing protein [Aliivibrio kagoshimensis]|uniref:diguanylate cyclase domain-containing protein n=1 Tax=Aliivibrio kagoshimensis TaxID=2910230 RepID=UPI003D13E870